MPEALRTIRGHRMRSGLLILGVTIGVTTLVAMATLAPWVGRNLATFDDPTFLEADRRHNHLTFIAAFGDRADAVTRATSDRPILRDALGVFPEGGTRIFGPVPAIMERMGGRSRMYLVLQSDSRAGLHVQVDPWLPRIRELRTARKVRWSMDIDPQEL